ncbi:hypothetical protein OROMI_016186 [Orobanche minor]
MLIKSTMIETHFYSNYNSGTDPRRQRLNLQRCNCNFDSVESKFDGARADYGAGKVGLPEETHICTSALNILTSKTGPRDYYKGKNCKPTGFRTRLGVYVVVHEKLPNYVVPDLSEFKNEAVYISVHG